MTGDRGDGSGTSRRAFTLVEALVVMGVISVLLGILLPSLASARRNAVILQCQARLASIGKFYEMSVADHRGELPTHEYPLDSQGVADPILVPEWGAGGGGWLILPINEMSFWAYNLRGYAMADANMPIITAVEQLSCPVVFREWLDSLPRRELGGAVQDPMASPGDSYAHSVALYTAISAWGDPDSPPDVNAAHTPVRAAHVASPSTKANLAESASHHGPRRVALADRAAAQQFFNVLALDGHVDRRSPSAPQRVSGFVGDGTGLERPSIRRTQWAERGIPFVSTRGGALGQDW